MSLASLEEEARNKLIVPRVRISSVEKLRREKVKEVGVDERSMEGTGVNVVDEEGDEEPELRLKRKREEKGRCLDEDETGVEDAVCSESLFDTAVRGEDGHCVETGDGGTEALSYSLGVVRVIDTGVAVPGVEEVDEDKDGSSKSLLRLLSEDEELTLALSSAAK